MDDFLPDNMLIVRPVLLIMPHQEFIVADDVYSASGILTSLFVIKNKKIFPNKVMLRSSASSFAYNFYFAALLLPVKQDVFRDFNPLP